jgi:hypothetical protein
MPVVASHGCATPHPRGAEFRRPGASVELARGTPL